MRGPRARCLESLLALGLLSAGGALAQERRPVPPDAGQLLSETDRERIHPGDAFVVVGREQGDNSFRERTPALLRSDRRLALVSPEAIRERKLALYEGGVFSSPLPAVGSVASDFVPSDEAAPVRRRAAPGRRLDPRDGERWLFAGCFLAIAGILWLVHRLRRRGSEA